MKQLLVVTGLLLFAACLPARNKWIAIAGDSQSSIKEMVKKAAPFDTILVKAGTYTEGEITINKPLVLIGEGSPVLDGEHQYQPLSIRSDYVVVTGFTIIKCGQEAMEDWAGIKLYGCKYVYVFNNILEDNYFGIYLSGVKHCFVAYNQVHASGLMEQTSGNGIHAWKCDSISITDNHSSGHRDGIYFEFVTNSRILRNLSERNIRYGLHFMFSHNNHYEDNTFNENGAGVAVMYSRNVSMVHNHFIQNRGSASYGILLKDIQGSTLSDNEFFDNTIGIYMEGCTRSHIERNVFRQNGWAIKVQASCDGNDFTHNNFFANTFDIATNNALVLNTFNENFWDKYEGYDLDKNQKGDVPYRPVSLFAMISEQMPYSMIFWRSFAVLLLDRAEKVIPSLSPDQLKDDSPLMKPYDTNTGNQ